MIITIDENEMFCIELTKLKFETEGKTKILKYEDLKILELPDTFTDEQSDAVLEIFKASYKAGFKTAVRIFQKLGE
ncbi:hypothetical protein [Nostoc phage YongM]|nr:hypothetical protein [Nostoc phage YongM]